MSGQRLEEDLRTLLAETSKAEVSAVELEDDLVRELGLDSLGGLRLLAGVEKRFDVRFPDDRLAEFRTMRQILVFIATEKGDDRP